ncbi:M16 family metallopeptidase [Pragia fontium]|uniref:M16 family metallopeptidase n=1 Tax=Pragia fontium TaxID=82985 RepID=UPI000F6E6A20|nr:insulinase family protein [Pragia fontium]VEJ52836.1 Peptidase M16 inactive domain [Pragia fontium]
MQFKYLLSALSGVMFMWVGSAAQAEALKADPAWQEGKLENGFKWQILATPHRPSDKIEVRLEVHAGSLQEGIQQTGFSYLLPHLAMEKTDSYESDEIQSLLPLITPETEPKSLVEVSYDYTRYNLSLPTNKPELLKEAFGWLSEAVSPPTASNGLIQLMSNDPLSPLITFPAGVNDAWWHYRIKNSPLVGHEPGRAVAEGATAERLNEFYLKWYTPDSMTLYVVGNVDRRAMVEQINKSFGGLSGKRLTPATIAALSALPATPVNFLSQGVEKDRLKLVWDDPWHPIVTKLSLERQWLSMIANDMIANRLNQKMGRGSAKNAALDFACQIQFQRYHCDLTIDTPLAAMKNNLKLVAAELVKLEKEGVTDAEFNTLLAEQKEQLAQIISTYAKTDTAQIMAQRLLAEKSGSITVSPESYQELRQKFLDGLDLMTVNTRINRLLTIKPTLVLTQPAGEPEENVRVLSEQLEAIMAPKADEAK